MWGSLAPTHHDHNLLQKYKSQLRTLEEAFLASKSSPCVLWDTDLGHFPFTSLTLLSNCVLIAKHEKLEKLDFERLSDELKDVYVCTLGTLSSWEKTLHEALSNLKNVHNVTIYTGEEREQGDSLSPIDVYEYVMFSGSTFVMGL